MTSAVVLRSLPSLGFTDRDQVSMGQLGPLPPETRSASQLRPRRLVSPLQGVFEAVVRFAPALQAPRQTLLTWFHERFQRLETACPQDRRYVVVAPGRTGASPERRSFGTARLGTDGHCCHGVILVFGFGPGSAIPLRGRLAVQCLPPSGVWARPATPLRGVPRTTRTVATPDVEGPHRAG